MCIICFKDEGQSLPSMEHLENCWSNHHDGAGMAWYLPDEETWQVKKGFMTLEDFKKEYLAQDFKPEDTFILHFRTGTSGKNKGRSAKQTHPFPVTSRVRNMEAMTYKAKKIVFHNGIVGAGSKEYSDTMFGVRDYVYPLLKYINDDNIYILLGELWDKGRVLITDGFQIYEYGKWITDEETGIMWSNDEYTEDKWDKWVTMLYAQKSEYGTQRSIGFTNTVYSDDFNSPYRMADGSFDWNAWDKDRGKRSESIMVDNAETTAPNETEDVENSSTVVGLVDNDMLQGFDATYDEKRVLANFLICPHCFEERYLDVSPYNQGDTVCLICGLVYDDPSGNQHFYDPDIHKKYKEQQKEVA